ncbi:hypothetical protein H671_2g6925 [Cricetulus griseus]|nr:hypothetical protein H671_2g6925 [Cricetulus griseus]
MMLLITQMGTLMLKDVGSQRTAELGYSECGSWFIGFSSQRTEFSREQKITRFHHAIGNNGTPETTKKEVVKIQDPGKNSQARAQSSALVFLPGRRFKSVW